MAWFHETLTKAQDLAEAEFKKATKNQDWTKVLEILEEHGTEEKHEEQGLSDAAFAINKYKTELFQIKGLLSEVKEGKRKVASYQGDLRNKFKSAIDGAETFEQILQRLKKKLN